LDVSACPLAGLARFAARILALGDTQVTVILKMTVTFAPKIPRPLEDRFSTRPCDHLRSPVIYWILLYRTFHQLLSLRAAALALWRRGNLFLFK
jgi:hypothetical protein